MRHLAKRVPSDLSANRLTLVRRRIGKIPFDLTISNPTICGFSYPEDLLEGLSHRRGLDYKPEPQGPLSSRRVLAAESERWGFPTDPEKIFLTASTSEAYSYLFRALCEPGEAVLFPSPSYPLFDQLARLDAVEPRVYDLDPDGNWRIDFSTIEDGPDGVRAIVVVHPNNPTGSFVHPEDRDRLVGICRERGWALIADEVFLPYPLDGGPGHGSTFATVEDCLCFTLGGLSKSVGLPQAKLAWFAIGGPEARTREAIAGLEWIADAYLSTSTPVALAVSEILASGRVVQQQISARCTKNLEVLRELVHPYPSMSVTPVGGGWSAVLRVPAVHGDEELCIQLLEECGVAVLPGLFFDFPRAGYLVLSLLVRGELFLEGTARALQWIDAANQTPP